MLHAPTDTPTSPDADTAQDAVNTAFLAQAYGTLYDLGAHAMRPVWQALPRVARKLLTATSDAKPDPGAVNTITGIFSLVLSCARTRVLAQGGEVVGTSFRWLADTPLARMLPDPSTATRLEVDNLADNLALNILSGDSDWFWGKVLPVHADTLHGMGVWPRGRALPGWSDHLMLGAFAYAGHTRGLPVRIWSAVVDHITRETGCEASDPRCETHPLVVELLATANLSCDDAALIPLLYSPVWVAIHGVELPHHPQAHPA